MMIILSAILFSFSAHADSKVLLQSEDVSKLDYQAFLKSEPGYKSAVDDQISNRVFRSVEKELVTAFDRAERSFLGDTVETAHQNYKRVLELALANDWTESERKLIFHCYLRTAQTALSAAKRLEYLSGSIKFDSRQSPDEKLFPPPMVAEWRNEKARGGMATLQLPESFQKYDAALVNGVRVDFKRFAIRVPAGPFRLTLLSNQLQPVSKVASAEELRSWIPQSSAFVSGTCESPALTATAPRNAAALFKNDCVANADQKNNTAIPQTRIATDLFNRNLSPVDPVSSSSVLKKPLFWGIAGAAVAFLAYSANRSKNNDAEPTHKTGF